LPEVLERLQSALVGRYTIERELGRGGMATVYLALDFKHDRLVALKVLHPELARALGPDRFVREIRFAAQLNHPHILPLHDSGEADGFLYYIMPYVEGESLRAHLESQKQLPVDDALAITQQVADALTYAHGHGVVHRDIKPENILLAGGHALLADFGIARAIGAAAGDKLTETGLAIGTPAYMSPEQSSGDRSLDGRADIYALGCVLYEMLAGAPPFTGPTAQSILARHAVDPVPSLHTVRQEVPIAVERAIGKALAKAPADRFATAAEFALALTAAAPATAALPIEESRRAGRPRWWVRAVIAALLIGSIAGAISILSRSRGSQPLDVNLIAIAPFDVLEPKLTLWREGLVDVLSRSLDGAGALRTVAPSLVIRRWSGRADRPSAGEVARRTGAGLAVFGSLVGAGPDSVRVTATLLDVKADRALAEIELRHAVDRMDGLVDSLAVRLLGELGRTRRVGLLRQAQTRSLPALKAFLQGEQHYRRMAWDSAQVHFERAVALDSTFALALRHLAEVHRWKTGSGRDSFAIYALRAARFNHGLPPRESLLVVAESLEAVLWEATTNAEFFGNASRSIGMWEEAVRQYPDDAEAWYGLAEARFHAGPEIGVTLRQQLEAFDRAIAIDSGFLLADPHAVSLGIRLEGTDLGLRYAEAYLARDPRGDHARGIRVVKEVLQQERPDSAMFVRWTDSLEGNRLRAPLRPLAAGPIPPRLQCA
jgi:serine/threonine-protein kinase